MSMQKDIVLAVDYHDNNMAIRRLDCPTGEEMLFKRPTKKKAIGAVMAAAQAEAA